MSAEVCAAAAAYLALGVLIGMCSSVILCSPYIGLMSNETLRNHIHLFWLV